MIPTKQMGAKSKVAVYVRQRPATAEEAREPAVVRLERAAKCIFVREQPADPEREFRFSDVLPPESQQDEVYDVVARANVDAIFDGHYSTILAYGQTGTGKTYTLASRAPGSEGIITRALQHIFDRIGRDEGHEYSVSLEFIQIYKEVINDLLRMDNRDLQIREDAERGVFLSNVTSVPVRTVEEALREFDAGTKHRTSALTSMNAESSRSHACFVLNVQRRKKVPADPECGRGQMLARGRLTIVDLAGSERLKKTNASGAQKQEAQAINLSLSCLGNVVHALTDPRTAHIPYRDSKLTRLLQESLGGCGKTSIVICISPSATHVGETVSTLLFGQRAACVEQNEVSYMEMDWKALALQLQAQLEQAHQYIAYLKDRGAGGPRRRNTPHKKPLDGPHPTPAITATVMPTRTPHKRERNDADHLAATLPNGIPIDFLLRSPSLHPPTRPPRPWNSPTPARNLRTVVVDDNVSMQAAALLMASMPPRMCGSHAGVDAARPAKAKELGPVGAPPQLLASPAPPLRVLTNSTNTAAAPPRGSGSQRRFGSVAQPFGGSLPRKRPAEDPQKTLRSAAKRQRL